MTVNSHSRATPGARPAVALASPLAGLTAAGFNRRAAVFTGAGSFPSAPSRGLGRICASGLPGRGQGAAPSRLPRSLTSLQAWHLRRPSRALPLARASTTAQGSSSSSSKTAGTTEPSYQELGSKAPPLGAAPSSTPVQPQQLAASKGSLLEWELGDGMAAAPGAATTGTGSSTTTSSSSGGSRLARLVPSSLASLLGLGTSASDVAAGSNSVSSSTSTSSLEEVSQGPSAGLLPGSAGTVGYLEEKPALFEDSSQRHAEAVEAWSAGDGMTADLAAASLRESQQQQQPSLYQVPAAAKAAATPPTAAAESKAAKQQQQQQRATASVRSSKVVPQGASVLDPPAAEAPSWDQEEFGQLLQELEGARLQAAGAVSSTVQGQQLEGSHISQAAATAEGATVARDAPEQMGQMGSRLDPANGTSLATAALSTPTLPAEDLQAGDSCSSEEGPGAVLALLRRRVADGSLPGWRTDGCKLGLVMEGGGMRGIVNGGALQALHDLGLRDAFDAVYGASAGALNATYFLSGQREGVHIYHSHIATTEFISLRRLWRGRQQADGPPAPVLNLGFLVDSVMHTKTPLDWDAVLRSNIPLKVVASCLDTLHPVLLSNFSSQADLAACLKASACVPEIAGGPISHRGLCLVDAAVFEPIPFRSAIADGCTHVLVLCNRPLQPWSIWSISMHLEEAVTAVVKRALMSPSYMLPAWQAELDNLRKDGMREDGMLLTAHQPESPELPWFGGSHVQSIMPGAAANFSPICIDAATLRAGLEEGRRMALSALKPALGDLLDFSRAEQASNIVSLVNRGGHVKSSPTNS